MAKKTVIAIVRRWFVKVFLPWFRDVVWPLIKEEVVAAVQAVIHDLVEQLREFLNDRSRRREEDARKRAAAAEQQAKAASSTAEMEKYKAIAGVWRQVADELRQDNEQLKQQLETLAKEAEKSVSRQIERLKPNVQATQSTLEIGDRRVPLLSPPEED